MQRWLLALDEPASNPCGSILVNHEPSLGGVIATALAVPAGNQNQNQNLNQNSPRTDGGGDGDRDGDGAKLALHLPNERYGCNPDCSLYAVPRTELHEAEWIEPDSIDAEFSRFVAGSSAATTTTRNNSRRCCRTSTSSGYSSHSPPLSGGSYSCYASAIPGQAFFRTVPLSIKDQFGGGLAVIHESETIPRPIWPSAFPGPHELYQTDENPEYDALYACCGCGCAYAYSHCDRDYEKTTSTSAHEILLELSQTLNSVIEGETAMTPEEILQSISHKVTQGIGLKSGIYEYVYHQNSSGKFLPGKKSLLSDKSSSLFSCGNRTGSSRINPVNSKLYTNARHLYLHNPGWYTSVCTCEHAHHRFLSTSSSSSKGDEETGIGNAVEKKGVASPVFQTDCQGMPTNRGQVARNNANEPVSGFRVIGCGCSCNCNSSRPSRQATRNAYANRRIGQDAKETVGLNGEKENRNTLRHGEPEYATLECSDGGSSSEGIVVASGKSNWDSRFRGFAGDLDFTLDVSRAERLGRAIAKAKRKRQWCRALTAFFGLVFFVLSVVIVSLSVTRGRKAFGSM
ncbi:uncharacterized protein LOC143208986 isoform X2 [Lasioglossum baleicum]|uniref:uncharacterized protein LOC143208986 isoform X2 n=1 Tax=Lasioglossum baleicum TaxID=434251 RepID=UPI003FCC9CEE